MGSGDTGTPVKTPKASSAQSTQPAQEHPPVQVAYPDWASAMQAYYQGIGPPPGYFPPPGTQPHPYLWGGQMIPPYAALYPHGAIYGHPALPPGAHPFGQYGMKSPGSGNETLSGAGEADGKSSDGQKTRRIKRSKGSLGSLSLLTGKGNDGEKGAAGPVSASQSADSESENSSNATDDDKSQNIQDKKVSDQLSSEGTPTIPPFGPLYMIPGSVPLSGKPGGPTTNLNIGMDYWNGGTPGAKKKRGSSNLSTAVVPSPINTQLMRGPGRGDGVPPEHWLQDERELKRQRRKQSNRESARRSRLRKQAECEELGHRVDNLTMENMTLHTELTRLTEECKKLTKDNATLLEELQQYIGNGGEVQEEGPSPVSESCRTFNGDFANSTKLGSKVNRMENETCDSSKGMSPALDVKTHPEAVAAG